MSSESKERKDTRVHLVAELNKLPYTPEIANMIEEATRGEYHDYKNDKYACGKMYAAGRLREIADAWRSEEFKAKCIALAQRIEQGEFDELADAEDRAMLRKTCPRHLWGVMGLEED